MIINFEDITEELNEYELGTLLPVFIAGMRRHIGRKNAIKTKYICSHLTAQGLKITPARVRKLVHFVRCNPNLPGSQYLKPLPGIIIGTSDGYFLSQDKEEIERCILSNKQRVRSIQEIVDGMEIHLFNLIGEKIVKA